MNKNLVPLGVLLTVAVGCGKWISQDLSTEKSAKNENNHIQAETTSSGPSSTSSPVLSEVDATISGDQMPHTNPSESVTACSGKKECGKDPSLQVPVIQEKPIKKVNSPKESIPPIQPSASGDGHALLVLSGNTGSWNYFPQENIQNTKFTADFSSLPENEKSFKTSDGVFTLNGYSGSAESHSGKLWSAAGDAVKNSQTFFFGNGAHDPSLNSASIKLVADIQLPDESLAKATLFVGMNANLIKKGCQFRASTPTQVFVSLDPNDTQFNSIQKDALKKWVITSPQMKYDLKHLLQSGLNTSVKKFGPITSSACDVENFFLNMFSFDFSRM